MKGENSSALVRKPSGAVEKAAPGAKRILSGMVSDTLALAKGPSLRIVILDDEPMLLELYELIIRDFCKEVTLLKFRNPEEALRELLREDPDLLITDMNHGKLSGDEMLPLLARKKVGFPILVISGTWGEEGVRQCAGSELNVSYMSKPIQFSEFRTVFETALKIPRNFRSRDETMSRKIAIHPAQLEGWFQKGKSCFESKNYTEAVSWYRMAAENNHLAAQFHLGCCCRDGQGIEKNEVEAVKWFLKAAEQNDADAQQLLGFCYRRGRGVEKDYAEAVKWHRKAAEPRRAGFFIRGHPFAILELGHCYEQGQGVPQDDIEAYKCYKLFADHEYCRDRLDSLKRIVTRMTAVEIAEGERRYKEFSSGKI